MITDIDKAYENGALVDPAEYITLRQEPLPPRMDLQQYIAAYFSERDDKYISWFLHYYETRINKAVFAIAQKYYMLNCFADLKQSYVLGILKALKHYDISIGVPFTVYLKHYAENEVMEFIRTTSPGYTTSNTAEFRKMRQIMAVWSDRYGRSSGDAVMEAIAAELGEKNKTIEEIIRSAMVNENTVPLFTGSNDADDEGSSREEWIGDSSADPQVLYLKNELYTRLWEAYDELEYEERYMLSQYCGFCFQCGSVFYMDANDSDACGDPKKKLIPEMKYTDIATDHGYSSADTVKRKCNAALEKLYMAIEPVL